MWVVGIGGEMRPRTDVDNMWCTTLVSYGFTYVCRRNGVRTRWVRHTRRRWVHVRGNGVTEPTAVAERRFSSCGERPETIMYVWRRPPSRYTQALGHTTRVRLRRTGMIRILSIRNNNDNSNMCRTAFLF